MNNGYLLYNKINIWKMSCVVFCFFVCCVSNCSVSFFSICGIVFELLKWFFCSVGVFCVIICCFESVYGIRCRFLYIWAYFKDVFRYSSIFNVPAVWTILVRIFCLRLFVICLDFGGPKWSPPSLASMSKFPSGGENMENKCFFNDFCDFQKLIYKKIMKNGTKMITPYRNMIKCYNNSIIK